MSVSAPKGPMQRSTSQSFHKPVALAIKYQAPLFGPVFGRYNPTFETIWRVNEATQDLLAFMVTEPSEQSASPPQPVNTEPGLGMACRVMMAVLEKVPEHLVPQSMPAGELTIFPLPLPAAVIVPPVLTVNV